MGIRRYCGSDRGVPDHGAGLRINLGESGTIHEESGRGAVLGFVPKQEDSGESQPQLGISKTGDTMLRKLLVGSAHYILGPFTDLRRYGLRLCERGGKNAKKRAAVAVARKLAVLLHCLWVSGEVYEPLRQGISDDDSVAVWLPKPRRADQETRNPRGVIFAEGGTQE